MIPGSPSCSAEARGRSLVRRHPSSRIVFCGVCKKPLRDGERRYYKSRKHYECGVDERQMERRMAKRGEESYREYKAQRKNKNIAAAHESWRERQDADMVASIVAANARGMRSEEDRTDALSWKHFLRYFRCANYSEQYAAECWKRNTDELGNRLQCVGEGSQKKLRMPMPDSHYNFANEVPSDASASRRSRTPRLRQRRQVSRSRSFRSVSSHRSDRRTARGRSERDRNARRSRSRSRSRSRRGGAAVSSTSRRPRTRSGGKASAVPEREEAAVPVVEASRSRAASETGRVSRLFKTGALETTDPNASPPAAAHKERTPKKKQPVTMEAMDALIMKIKEAPDDFKESIHMEAIQEAIVEYYEGTQELDKIDGISIDSWLAVKLDKVGHLQRVKNLGCDKLRNSFNASLVALGKCRDDCKNWIFGEVNFKAKRSHFFECLLAYEEEIAKIHRIKGSLSKAESKTKEEVMAARAEMRNARDRYRTYFEGTGIAPALAKAMGDILIAQAWDPGELQMAWTFNSPVCDVVVSSSRKCFLIPFVIPAVSGSKPINPDEWLRAQFDQLFKDMQAECKEKYKQCLKVMQDPTKLRNSAIGTCAANEDLKWHPPEEVVGTDIGLWPKTAAKLRHCLWTCYCDVLECGIDGWPFRFLEVFLTVQVGKCVVVLVSGEEATRQGELKPWLERLEVKDLQSFPVWYLEEGDTLHCPLGTQPLIVGVPDSVDVTDKKVELKVIKEATKAQKKTPANKKSKDAFALSVCAVFDAEYHREDANPAMLSHIGASWMRAQAWIPQSWKTNESAVKWHEFLSESVTAFEGCQAAKLGNGKKS